MEHFMEMDVHQNRKLLIVWGMATNANVEKQVTKMQGFLVASETGAKGVKVVIVAA